MAGLMAKNAIERNAIGIITSMPELEERFVEISVKRLGIEPERIQMERLEDGKRLVYFYDSRLWKELANMVDRELVIFKSRDEISAMYVAGIFDACAASARGHLFMNRLSNKDLVMLQNLGIHVIGNKIMNVSSLVTLISNYSVLLEIIHRPGNERDPH